MKRFLNIMSSHKGWYAGGFLVAFIALSCAAVAHAQDNSNISSVFGFDLFTLMVDALANFFYNMQMVASWLITIAGALLNFSMNLTLHIKEFVNATESIYTVWTAIRDLSGMFIIFGLLYAAIMLITSYQKPNFGGLIKNIVVAGVLINFSFFITSLAIDVSNIVSLQLYNAIAPQDQSFGTTAGVAESATSVAATGGIVSAGTINKFFEASTGRVGLANIFMQSLGITRLYNPDSGALSRAAQAKGAVTWSAPIKVIVIGTTSIIIMITAALSFFLAALAFIIRFVILLFLLAFSPIVFAATVIPEIGEYSKKWLGWFKSQLLFMPAYLLLMYFSLSVLTSSSIFKNGYIGSLTNGGGFEKDLLLIAVNAVLVIVMMNIPLVAAMQISGKDSFLGKVGGKFTADAVWKKFGGFAGGVAGRATIGRIGSSLDKALANSKMGNSLIGRDIRAGTTGALAKAKFGSGRSYEDERKLQEEVDKERKLIESGNTAADKKRKSAAKSERLDTILGELNAGRTPPAAARIAIKAALGDMNEKEKVGVDIDKLVNPNVIRFLGKGEFDAIKKSDDISDEDKRRVVEARKTTLENAIRAGDTPLIKDMLKSYEGTDILKLDNTLLDNDAIMPHYSTGQLKNLGDNTNDMALKGRIADKALHLSGMPSPIIGAPPPVPVRGAAFGWLIKQRREGTW